VRVAPSIDVVSAEYFRDDPTRVSIFAHPLRIKIIRLAQGRELSAKEASELLDEPIAKVSYHVRVLAEAGVLELVRQMPRRGAVESYYRALVSIEIDDDAWKRAGPGMWRPLMSASVQGWMSDMVHAVESGGFEFDGAMLGNTHFEADEEGIEELRRALTDHYDRLLEIEAAIEARKRVDPDVATTALNVGFALHGGERTAGRHSPLVIQHSPPALPLIPEEFPPSDG
jgi:DNA-binding transcriptional ArsR family regulator